MKESKVRLKGVFLTPDKDYIVEYYTPAGTMHYCGTFDAWDAARDEFAFKGLTPLDPSLVLRGDDVLLITPMQSMPSCPPQREAKPINVGTVGHIDHGETDPNGLDSSQPGAKLDAGKVYADSILAGFPRALFGVAEVGTFGANKYSLNGWQSVEDGERRYRDAAARHRLYRQKGELIDPDSGLPHEFHEAWNVLAALEIRLTNEG